ncbi:MAG TPA: hypothetical protein VGQ23_14220 [Burkholderiaceae bacterium]|nr:hypothetical protein [Burkholderiaceae bacterium]
MMWRCVVLALGLACAWSAGAAPSAPSVPALAIVVQDQAALRAAPRASAAQQAVLWQGDALELRGQRFDYVQVYDHRRERAGYVHASQLRRVSLAAPDAPEALAVLRFLRETPGSEALGIAYAAAYLRAADAPAIDAEPFDAIGTMAERLARRASARQGKAGDAIVAAHLEVASTYGVAMKSFEREGRLQLCYDGEAFRRVLALPASAEQRARATLALTRHDCVDPALRPAERKALDQWRAELLERVDLPALPEPAQNRVRLRRAGVWAGIAYQRQRRGEAHQEAAERALQALAGINKSELADSEDAVYAEAAVRAGASRWAAEPAPAAHAAVKLDIMTRAGPRPGETCVGRARTRRHRVRRLGARWHAHARRPRGPHRRPLPAQLRGDPPRHAGHREARRPAGLAERVLSLAGPGVEAADTEPALGAALIGTHLASARPVLAWGVRAPSMHTSDAVIRLSCRPPSDHHLHWSAS